MSHREHVKILLQMKKEYGLLREKQDSLNAK